MKNPPARLQPRRSTSITFAPHPIDQSFERRDINDGVKLDLASIGSVTRHLAALAVAYQNAPPSQKYAARRDMVRHGAGMFADYVRRHSTTHPNAVWSMKGPRMVGRDALEYGDNRGPTLKSFYHIVSELNPHQEELIKAVERRRSILICEVGAAKSDFFSTYGVQHSASMQGVLVGCMLEGAVRAIQGAKLGTYTAVLGTAVALCNAVEHAFLQTEKLKGRAAADLRMLPEPSQPYWRDDLAQKSLSAVRNTADNVARYPDALQSKDAEAEFAASLRRIFSFPVAPAADGKA